MSKIVYQVEKMHRVYPKEYGLYCPLCYTGFITTNIETLGKETECPNCHRPIKSNWLNKTKFWIHYFGN